VQVQFVLDYRSPFAYLANTRLKTLGTQIDYQPIGHDRRNVVGSSRLDQQHPHLRILCQARGHDRAWPPELQVVSMLDLTEDVLRLSGIKRGMRVLDLGCGTGDASLLIAKLVGPSGLVLGVDPSAAAIDVAQKRATVAGQCYWARFIAADLDTFVPAEPFDAVVVRLTLLRQRVPAATSLRLSAYVRPDGRRN
jgi:SAM-dependent methyltransferase